jgi:hypothetical protein
MIGPRLQNAAVGSLRLGRPPGPMMEHGLLQLCFERGGLRVNRGQWGFAGFCGQLCGQSWITRRGRDQGNRHPAIDGRWVPSTLLRVRQ